MQVRRGSRRRMCVQIRGIRNKRGPSIQSRQDAREIEPFNRNAEGPSRRDQAIREQQKPRRKRWNRASAGSGPGRGVIFTTDHSPARILTGW